MTYYPHAKIYLEGFEFATPDCLAYPDNIIHSLNVSSIEFAPITIFYGGNGCGKSTLLNIIGRRLGVPGSMSGNDSEQMESYILRCHYDLKKEKGRALNFCDFESAFIRSEMIMNAIVRQREKQFQIKEKIRECSEDWNTDLFDSLYGENSVKNLSGLSDFERNWLDKIGYFDKPEMESNGQCALKYFEAVLMPDRLYLLDEPENSLSPLYQKELAGMIEQYAYLFGCQFLIATHSPFLLAMNDVKIYDLDNRPVTEKTFTELENMKLLYELFNRFSNRFTGKFKK